MATASATTFNLFLTDEERLALLRILSLETEEERVELRRTDGFTAREELQREQHIVTGLYEKVQKLSP